MFLVLSITGHADATPLQLFLTIAAGFVLIVAIGLVLTKWRWE